MAESLQFLRSPELYTETAESMYNAYAAVTDNKNFQGNPMPNFADLPPKIQSAWEAAARQAFEPGNPERFKNWIAPRFNDAHR